MILKICSVAFSALLGFATLHNGMGLGKAFLVFVLCVPGSMLGWKIGKAIRDFADPMFVSSNSIFGLAMEKFNALYGMQITGFIFGLLIPFGLFNPSSYATTNDALLSKKETAKVLDVEMIPVQGGYYNAYQVNHESWTNNLSFGEEMIVSVPTFAISETVVTVGLNFVLNGDEQIRKSDLKKEYNFAKSIESWTWVAAIVFCNKLSVKNKLNPCYSFNGTTDTEEWFKNRDVKVYDEIFDSVECDFSANGYRLPTEIEWEYARWGGNPAPNKIIDTDANTLGIRELGEICWNWLSDDMSVYADDITGPKNPSRSEYYGYARVTRNRRLFPTGKPSDKSSRQGLTVGGYRYCHLSLVRTISDSECKKLQSI